MKFLWAASAAFFAVSASPERLRPIDGPRGIDGYVFQQKEMRRLDLRLRVVQYPSRHALAAAHPNPPKGLLAFAEWNSAGCVIHVLDPAIRYEPHILGHELAHCLHGNFHPGQETAR